MKAKLHFHQSAEATHNHVEKKEMAKILRKRRMENTKVSFNLRRSRNVDEEKVLYLDGWFESYALYSSEISLSIFET